MLQKTKIIIIALGAILLMISLFTMKTYQGQRLAEQERDNFKKDNAAFTEKVKANEFENKRLQERLSSLGRDNEKLSQEKDKLKKDFELIKIDRDNLIEKLKSKPVGAPAPVVVEEVKRPSASRSEAEEAYWAGIIKAKAELELQLVTIRNELKSVQITNEQFQREKSNTELEIKNLNRQNQDLKAQLDYNQKVVDSITQELVREKSDKMQIEDSTKAVKNENTTLIRQLKALGDAKIELERKIAELQNKSRELEANVTKMETALKDRLLKIDELKDNLGLESKGPSGAEVKVSKESVELPPIIVRSQQDAPTAESIPVSQPEVLLVNKENNFVIVNVGENTGVKVGDVLRVFREDKPIAAIEAIQIRRNFSACDIKKEEFPIKIGDKVK